MNTSKNKNLPSPKKEIEAEEWDLSENMGILPDDIPLTQIIGCAGGKSKKITKSIDHPNTSN